MTDSSAKDRAFKEAYAALNAAQKEAVDTIEGPVMVVAGPGTGKTQILTLRIANILLKTDAAPENILALTFTESGAKAMRERLVRYIGKAAYRVGIYTFHGFAGQLIRQYPDAFPRVIGGRPASDIEKISLIESIIESGGYSVLRPHGNPQYYITPIIRMLGSLKQENVSPNAFRQIIDAQQATLDATEQYHTKGAHKGKVRGDYTKLEKTIAKNEELLNVYRAYEALLQEQNLYDFEDMLVEAVAVLEEKEDVLRDLQETYQYILADEHQDVNGVQNALLKHLVSFHDQPNIFAVGDEKQAIYRFQGASLENFLYFEDAFPGTKTIALSENYRSGQPILDAAHSLVAVEDGPLKDLRVPLHAALVPEANVSSRTFSHQVIEDQWVVEDIKAALEAGVDANQVAVIVRTNREVERFAALLRKAAVAVEASADGDVLQHPVMTRVLEFMAAITAPEDEVALFALLHAPYWQLSSADLMKVLSGRRYDRSLASILESEDVLTELKVENREAVAHIVAVLENARTAATHQAPQEQLETALQASGFIEHLLHEDPVDGVRVLRRIYDEVEELVQRDGVRDLRSVLTGLRLRQEYGIPLMAPYIRTHSTAVQVMTAHKSKGLEFERVYLPHLVDSAWGGSTRRNYFDIPLTTAVLDEKAASLDDERRLLFVGCTRAASVLLLSSSGENAEGKELLPSRLLLDLDPASVEVVATAETEAAFSVASTLQSATVPRKLDQSVIQTLFTERGFSATSLNNYLRSPWDYIYRNLLRIPEVQGVSLLFGTAVHNVLERATRQHSRKEGWPSTSDIFTWLKHEFNRLPITEVEYARLSERAQAALVPYLEHLEATVTGKTIEEVSLTVELPTGNALLPSVRLTGKLDRIDLSPDGTALRVIDYKTGKPRTRNVIEGKTASSDGEYKRQLVFYALLLSLADQSNLVTREAVLSFVEPDSKGVIKEEAFSVTDEEIATLKEEIIAAALELHSGSFLAEPYEAGSGQYDGLVTRWLDAS